MSRTQLIGCVAFFLLAALTVARADTITFPNFDSTSGLTLNGAASQHGGVLRLTPDVGSQSGSAWYSEQQPVAGGFTSSFRFQITHSGIEYADGIWFYVQNYTLSMGSNLYGANQNSLAVEFDDFQNTWDPNANHVAFLSCGANPNPPATITDHTNGCTLGMNSNLPVNFSDGAVHTATVTYTPGQLSLALDGHSVLSSGVDIGTLLNLNNGTAWVGFMTTTGAYSENNDILSWTYQPTSPVPEPSSIFLLSTGLILLVLLRHRGFGRLSRVG